MHDGRFATIGQVFDHYTTGIKNSATLDQLMKQDNGNPGIPLSAVERQAILVFLQTLTDNMFITNPKFSNPF
jgi:cytochrome c peroxidase